MTTFNANLVKLKAYINSAALGINAWSIGSRKGRNCFGDAKGVRPNGIDCVEPLEKYNAIYEVKALPTGRSEVTDDEIYRICITTNQRIKL